MSTLDRRDFMIGTVAVTAAAATGSYGSTSVAAEGGVFVQAPLPYAFDALEPWIDAETMSIHYGKHHAAYVRNLNNALKDHGEVAKLGLVKMLQELNSLPESIRTAVRHMGGGDYNHTLFWNSMGPGESAPSPELQAAIDRDLGGLDKLKDNFDTTGAGVFGSGYAFLVTDDKGTVEIVPKANQDCPLTDGKTPLMTNDVWEHAYYLKYQNRRGEYLKAWWNVVDWDAVSDRYSKAVTA